VSEQYIDSIMHGATIKATASSFYLGDTGDRFLLKSVNFQQAAGLPQPHIEFHVGRQLQEICLLPEVQTASGAHPATCSMGTGVPHTASTEAGTRSLLLQPSADVRNERSYPSTLSIYLDSVDEEHTLFI